MQDATRARARQRPGRHGHAALATLGREAIACRDPTALLQAAAHAVAKVLGAERSAVFERLPDRDALALRSGFGWSEDAALVLRSGTRLDLEDLAGESAVSPPPLLVEQG